MTTAFGLTAAAIVLGSLGLTAWCLNYFTKVAKDRMSKLEKQDLRIKSLQRTTEDWLDATSLTHRNNLRGEMLTKIRNLSKA